MVARAVPVMVRSAAPRSPIPATVHVTVTVTTPPGSQAVADTDTDGPPAHDVPAAVKVAAADDEAAAVAAPASRSIDAARAATAAAWVTPSEATPRRPKNTNINTAPRANGTTTHIAATSAPPRSSPIRRRFTAPGTVL